MAEAIKVEKKRKQMEAIADDLFNNEKVCIAYLCVLKTLLALDAKKYSSLWLCNPGKTTRCIWYPSRALCSSLTERYADVKNTATVNL